MNSRALWTMPGGPDCSPGGIQPPGSLKTTTSPRWMPPIRLTRILSCSWISGSIEPVGT